MTNPWGTSFGAPVEGRTEFIESFEIEENEEMVNLTLTAEENSVIINDESLVITEDSIELYIEEDENE